MPTAKKAATKPATERPASVYKVAKQFESGETPRTFATFDAALPLALAPRGANPSVC
jgi:hypothetical protein